jgi:hypothetical protein
MNEQFTELISLLLASNTQAQIFHRQTKSFSEHMTLNTYYDEIIDHIDNLTEWYQGKYGILVNYKAYNFQNYTDVNQVITYFKELEAKLTTLRKAVPDSYIQNEIDATEELIYSTLYKLINLK